MKVFGFSCGRGQGGKGAGAEENWKEAQTAFKKRRCRESKGTVQERGRKDSENGEPRNVRNPRGSRCSKNGVGTQRGGLSFLRATLLFTAREFCRMRVFYVFLERLSRNFIFFIFMSEWKSSEFVKSALKSREYFGKIRQKTLARCWAIWNYLTFNERIAHILRRHNHKQSTRFRLRRRQYPQGHKWTT